MSQKSCDINFVEGGGEPEHRLAGPLSPKWVTRVVLRADRLDS